MEFVNLVREEFSKRLRQRLRGYSYRASKEEQKLFKHFQSDTDVCILQADLFNLQA